MLLWHILQNGLNVLPESHIQHFICFIQYDHANFPGLDCMPAHMIHHTSRCSHNNLYTAAQRSDLSVNILAAINR